MGVTQPASLIPGAGAASMRRMTDQSDSAPHDPEPAPPLTSDQRALLDRYLAGAWTDGTMRRESFDALRAALARLDTLESGAAAIAEVTLLMIERDRQLTWIIERAARAIDLVPASVRASERCRPLRSVRETMRAVIDAAEEIGTPPIEACRMAGVEVPDTLTWRIMMDVAEAAAEVEDDPCDDCIGLPVRHSRGRCPRHG